MTKRKSLDHKWNREACEVCGLARRLMKGGYVYKWPGQEAYRSLQSRCKSPQSLLFDAQILHLPPQTPEIPPHEADKIPPPKYGERLKKPVFDMPKRDVSPVDMTIQMGDALVTLSMDGDGRWGGHSSDWCVLIVKPPDRLPWRGMPRRFTDTFPYAIDAACELMWEVRGLIGAQVYLSTGDLRYIWQQVRPNRWVLC